MSAEAEWDVGRGEEEEGGAKKADCQTLTPVSNLPCSPPLMVRDQVTEEDGLR